MATKVEGGVAFSAGLRALRVIGHWNRVRYGIRNRLLYAAFDPRKSRDIEFQVDLEGLRYRGNFANYIDWVVFFFGSYETYILSFLRDVALALGGDAIVFVDVGSNVGQHSLFMARHAASVHAFEPYALVREQMEGKLRDNGIRNVTVHPVALGDSDEALTYFAPDGTNTGSGGFVKGTEGIQRTAIGKLAVVQGDGYFRNQGIDKVDLVKLDIEGFEVFALRGLADVVARNRPFILMEFAEMTRDRLRGVSDLLALVAADYVPFALEGPRPMLKVFSESPTRWRLAPFRWEKQEQSEVVLAPTEKLKLLPANHR